MNSFYHDSVKEFHEQFGHPHPSKSVYKTYSKQGLEKLFRFRLSLIKEEYEEFVVGLQKESMIEMIDGLTDLLYVVEGTFVELGINDEMHDYSFEETTQNKFSNNDLNHFSDILKTFISHLEKYFLDEKITTCILTNIIFSIYIISQMLHFDLHKAFIIVHDNNMSKLCKTEEEAIQSVDAYKKNPVFINQNIKYRQSNDNRYYVVYNHVTGKILKSINWKEPDLSPIVNRA